MESGDQNGRTKNHGSEMWDWPEDEYCWQRDSRNDLSPLLWDEVNQTELFCMLDEQTPIKDCTDFVHQGPIHSGDIKKCSEDYRESLLLNRRRMLHFNCDSNGAKFAEEQMNSTIFKSKVMECSRMEATTSEWNREWPFNFQDDNCAFTCDELDPSSDGWLTDCLNENAMRWSFNEMKNEVVVNKQADISEYYDNSVEMETDVVQETPPPAQIRVSKSTYGKQACMKPPRELSASIVYPFALIKPCGVHGDVTLSDINQRIHAPPPSSLKHKIDEDPSITLPTSTFSGKPVVLKTKIRTEGGVGSITIMRTKG